MYNVIGLIIVEWQRKCLYLVFFLLMFLTVSIFLSLFSEFIYLYVLHFYCICTLYTLDTFCTNKHQENCPELDKNFTHIKWRLYASSVLNFIEIPDNKNLSNLL